MNCLTIAILALIAVIALARPQGRVVEQTTIIRNGGGGFGGPGNNFGGPGGNFGGPGGFNNGPGFNRGNFGGPGGNFGGPGRFGPGGQTTVIKETVIRG